MMVSVVALLVLGLAASVQSQTVQCHNICDCIQTPDGLAIICSGRDLVQLPDLTLLPGFSASSVTELYLNDNKLTTLGRNNFQGAPNIRILSAARNNITRWRRDTFEGLDKLEFLSMEENPIEQIDPDDTLDFPSLKEFIMTNHRVQTIPNGLFPDSIEIIRVDHGLLIELPTLGHMPKLVTVSASNNKIQTLRKLWFQGIVKPKSGSFLLDLNQNPITYIDREFIRPQNQHPTCRPEYIEDMKGDSLFWFELRVGHADFSNPCDLNYWVNFLSPRSQYPNFVDPGSNFLAGGDDLLGYFRGRCRDNWICSVITLPSSAIRPGMTASGAMAIAFAALITLLVGK